MKKIILLTIGCFCNLLLFAEGNFAPNYRWRRDDGNEKTATWYTYNNPILTSPDHKIRLRYYFLGQSQVNAKLFYSKNGGSRQEITASPAGDFVFVSSSFVPHGTPTTKKLTPYDAQQTANYTFTPGYIVSKVENRTGNVPAGYYTEVEFVIKPTVHVTPSAIYDFYDGVGQNITYAQPPVAEISMGYPVAPVDNGSNDLTDFAVVKMPAGYKNLIDNDKTTFSRANQGALILSVVTYKTNLLKSFSIANADSLMLTPFRVSVTAYDSIGANRTIFLRTAEQFTAPYQRKTYNITKNMQEYDYYEVEISTPLVEPCTTAPCKYYGIKVSEVELLRNFSIAVTNLSAGREGLKNKINWSAAYEKNNLGFRVEYRKSGTQSWQKLTDVAGKGNTTGADVNNYEAYDNKPQEGVTEYRISYIEDKQETSTDPVSITVNPDVKLAGASGKVVGNDIRLEIKTQYEIANTEFKLEKSIDSGKTYKQIIIAGGGTTGPVTYTYTDTKPIIGGNMYRLRYISNGTEVVSPAATIMFNESFTSSASDLSVYPNPVESDINFKLGNYSGKIFNVTLTNRMGQKVFSKKITANTLNNYHIGLASKLPTGIYYLTVTDNNYQRSTGISVN